MLKAECLSAPAPVGSMSDFGKTGPMFGFTVRFISAGLDVYYGPWSLGSSASLRGTEEPPVLLGCDSDDPF